jgi:hypothetical protein
MVISAFLAALLLVRTSTTLNPSTGETLVTFQLLSRSGAAAAPAGPARDAIITMQVLRGKQVVWEFPFNPLYIQALSRVTHRGRRYFAMGSAFDASTCPGKLPAGTYRLGAIRGKEKWEPSEDFVISARPR